MKTSMSFCAIFLLIACSIAPVLADAPDFQIIPHERDFILHSVEVAGDGSFLLAGSSGDPDSVPQMQSINAEGKIIWSQKQEGLKGSNVYRDAEYLDQDTILALCSVRDDRGEITDEWTVQFIKQGVVIHQTESLVGVSGIHCVSDGFFTLSTPDSHSARIEKFNAEGESMWEIEWEERLSFTGIVSQGNQHVAYGSKTIPANDRVSRPTSVVLAFDDHGNLLWRHDSKTNEGYRDATWTNNHLVLIGNTTPPSRRDNPDPDLDRAEHGFITEFAERGQIWRVDYTYTLPEDDFALDNLFTSVLPVKDGYLVSQIVNHTMKILLMNADGKLVKEWNEEIGSVDNPLSISLLESNSVIYLVASGYDAPIGNTVDDHLSPGRITIIKKINIQE